MALRSARTNQTYPLTARKSPKTIRCMCILCTVDVNLVVPVAQASLIAAPIVFRREIGRTISWLQGGEPGVEGEEGDPTAEDAVVIDRADQPDSGAA